MRLIGNSKLLYGTLFVIIAGVVFTSCHTKPVNEQKGTEIPILEMEKNEAIFEVTGYPLPNSFYITSLLEETGAPYLPALSNSVDNADHYFLQPEKALNLGIYGADLCYSVTFMETQQILLYLNVSKRLLNEINAFTDYYKDCCQRVEDNINNEDSLVTIISDSFFETYSYLTGNQKDKLAVLVIAGSWIESLYISTQLGLVASNNKKILEIVVEQQTSLDKLLDVMKPLMDDADVNEIYTELLGIKSIYGNSEEGISQETYRKLTTIIDSLRNKII